MCPAGLPSWLLPDFPLHIPTSSIPFPGHWSLPNEKIHQLIQLLPLRPWCRDRSLLVLLFFNAWMSQQWGDPQSLISTGGQRGTDWFLETQHPKYPWEKAALHVLYKEKGKDKKRKLQVLGWGFRRAASSFPAGNALGIPWAHPDTELLCSALKQHPPNYCYGHSTKPRAARARSSNG